MFVDSSDPQLWDVVLRDGSTLTLRPTRHDDKPAILTFLNDLSPGSRYHRFFGVPTLNAATVDRLLPADRSIGCAMVAETGRLIHPQREAHAGPGRIVALASYHRSGDRAEVAFAIADAMQGLGVGTRLLERLADLARHDGIRVFDADVMGENQKMMDVFIGSGFQVSHRIDAGVFRVELLLAETPAFAERAARRSQVAATASMKPFFEPRVVAVVGANRQRGRIGSEILHNLLASGFRGAVIPVHPTAVEIEGRKAYRRVSDVPGDVDLAVIVVPASGVLDAVDDCVAKGVRALCVISAGFSEAGPEGRAREAALLERVRDAGCRLVGPNCMGLLNTDPSVQLNATFSPVYPPAGNVAMSTQSGALGLAILDYARQLNIGISSFVSVGNKSDVSGNDLIQYWADDQRTSVILLYLESFGNPRKFGEIARRVGRVKPIVAVKAGRSSAGARAASSHTGALATSDSVVDALFRQAGVIRTDTLEEMFGVAAFLAHQPIPRGGRVAIVTNAGGPGILAADACEAHGLELTALSDATMAELSSFLPPAASAGNPVDVLASAPVEHYQRALSAILRDDQVDSVLAIFIPPLVTDTDAVAAAIAAAAREISSKPVVGVFMRAQGAPPALAPIPCYAFPESAAIALARVTAYGAWQRRTTGAVPTLTDFAASGARGIVDRALLRGGGWLTIDETQNLMLAAGIVTAPAQLTSSVEEAAAAASLLGFPVVLKGVGPSLLHKTERDAVRLNLGGPDAVRSAADDLTRALAGELSGLLVQRMIPGGVEMLVGALQDPIFGPLVVCGSGGVLVELLADSAFRLHPITPDDAAEMVAELRGARLLRGYRGAPPADEAALRDVLVRVSALLTACAEICELDINPLKVLRSGVCAVDVRVRVDQRPPVSQTRRVQY